MHAVIDNADAEEEGAGHEAMRQHLEDAALNTVGIGGEDAHRHVAHMSNR